MTNNLRKSPAMMEDNVTDVQTNSTEEQKQ